MPVPSIPLIRPRDRPDTAMADVDSRSRIMQAATRCAARSGVQGFSMEDVATEAQVSRTTIYRYFPDGRTQLITETVTWEIGRFWSRLAEAVEHLPTMEDRLVAGLVIGRKLMSKSKILANLRDRDVVELIEAAQPSDPLVRSVIRSYMESQVREEQEAGRFKPSVDSAVAADYLARMTLSCMGSSPTLDLADEEGVREMVRTQFLGALLDHPVR